jgi:hypothetical protein
MYRDNPSISAGLNSAQRMDVYVLFTVPCCVNSRALYGPLPSYENLLQCLKHSPHWNYVTNYAEFSGYSRHLVGKPDMIRNQMGRAIYQK